MTQNPNVELELLSDEDLVKKFNEGQQEVLRYYLTATIKKSTIFAYGFVIQIVI